MLQWPAVNDAVTVVSGSPAMRRISRTARSRRRSGASRYGDKARARNDSSRTVLSIGSGAGARAGSRSVVPASRAVTDDEEGGCLRTTSTATTPTTKSVRMAMRNFMGCSDRG